jgi:hypothetical protein
VPGDVLISWFPDAGGKGRPALGDPETMAWHDFCGVYWYRREGVKDGPGFVPARFIMEQDGRHVRRLKRNLLARTAVALDVETSKTTGEIPPSAAAAGARIKREGLAAALYTSHSHTPAAPRYRIVMPITREIAPELPAVEAMAERLGMTGVIDGSKVGASSFFYLPSADPDAPDGIHETHIIPGEAIDAAWLIEAAGIVLAARQAEADRIATAAHAEAQQRREARLAAGFDPDDSLIERLRAHLDLAGILAAHGYDRAGSHYRHPNSDSGSFGADIKVFGGVPRVFSHNAGDPLHASNLPTWCTVTAVDVFDVAAILDFGGDRRRALTQLAQRFGLTKAGERKALAALLFRLRRQQTPSEIIERAALAEGERLGLTGPEIVRVVLWCAEQPIERRAA